eukprot:TRINITY_DN47380_c0_g2_i3.p1 TRINITY_DN47380_c0_g2~~TRINITY_DN47380_c0_g2_i3.p1  ORF type:complete len:560 (-),score=100.99 TRINITY_DN47380_c0_g2_i3:53-1732(-)
MKAQMSARYVDEDVVQAALAELDLEADVVPSAELVARQFKLLAKDCHPDRTRSRSQSREPHRRAGHVAGLDCDEDIDRATRDATERFQRLAAARDLVLQLLKAVTSAGSDSSDPQGFASAAPCDAAGFSSEMPPRAPGFGTFKDYSPKSQVFRDWKNGSQPDAGKEEEPEGPTDPFFNWRGGQAAPARLHRSGSRGRSRSGSREPVRQEEVLQQPARGDSDGSACTGVACSDIRHTETMVPPDAWPTSSRRAPPAAQRSSSRQRRHELRTRSKILQHTIDEEDEPLEGRSVCTSTGRGRSPERESDEPYPGTSARQHMEAADLLESEEAERCAPEPEQCWGTPCENDGVDFDSKPSKDVATPASPTSPASPDFWPSSSRWGQRVEVEAPTRRPSMQMNSHEPVVPQDRSDHWTTTTSTGALGQHNLSSPPFVPAGHTGPMALHGTGSSSVDSATTDTPMWTAQQEETTADYWSSAHPRSCPHDETAEQDDGCPWVDPAEEAWAVAEGKAPLPRFGFDDSHMGYSGAMGGEVAYRIACSFDANWQVPLQGPGARLAGQGF